MDLSPVKVLERRVRIVVARVRVERKSVLPPLRRIDD